MVTDIDARGAEQESEYRIEGGTMTIISADGNETVLTRRESELYITGKQQMKKAAIIFAALLAVSLTACGAESSAENSAAEIKAAESSQAALNALSDAFGTWLIELEDGVSELRIVSEREAYLRNTIPADRDFYFDESMQFFCTGKPVAPEDYSLKDGVFSFVHNGKCYLEMEKTDGSDSLLGEYRLTGGEYVDVWSDSGSLPDSILITLSAGGTTVSAEVPFAGFVLTADTIITDLDGDGEPETAAYTIDGDTMTFSPKEDTVRILTRKK